MGETLDHILLHCSYLSFVWDKVREEFGLSWVFQNLEFLCMEISPEGDESYWLGKESKDFRGKGGRGGGKKNGHGRESSGASDVKFFKDFQFNEILHNWRAIVC